MEEKKHDISLEYYTYRDFKRGFDVPNDPFGIGSYANLPERHKAFVECPFVNDEDFVMLIISRVDGVVGGRGMNFPTLFKAGNEILPSLGGSSLFVAEKYRNLDIAVDITTCAINKKRTSAAISADFSEDGINVCRALRQHIFSMRKMMLARNSRFFFENVGMKGGCLKVASFMLNLFLRPAGWLLNYRLPQRLKPYIVKEVKTVPSWVDKIVLNDGHKYMEVHDHRWLQWCLNNKFHDLPQNINRFFTVEKDGESFGFFMTKERYAGIPVRNISPMLTGTIVEWGSKDERVLSEYDIVRLAIPTFSLNIDMIQFVSDNEETLKQAKIHGFMPHGVHYVVHRDVAKRFKEAKDQTLWRLRFGYADSIMN